ncbi:hypothetical protein N9E48_04020 [Paracoccaceae bacterium]|nr:hypothetical protein [Paracoccaceae bacterium]
MRNAFTVSGIVEDLAEVVIIAVLGDFHDQVYFKKTYQCVAVRSYGLILDHFCRYWARARQRNKNYASTQFFNLESSNSYAVA